MVASLTYMFSSSLLHLCYFCILILLYIEVMQSEKAVQLVLKILTYHATGSWIFHVSLITYLVILQFMDNFGHKVVKVELIDYHLFSNQCCRI
uniref:Uncharacterized protein n=1 Tax=Rhizophora mucronata TaxID=61149 RepID=A0A2P2LJG8_RHIMU